MAVKGDDMPLVSVIVRSMDRPTLEEALASVAAQTYRNIEVLVVNARGRNHLPLPEFRGRLALRQIDTGAPLSRSRAANTGLEAAAGRFLIFLDDDDLLLPDHVSKLTAALLDGEARAVYSGVRLVDLSGTVARVFDEPWVPARLRAGNFIPIHAVLFDRSLVAGGCRFDERLDYYEDWDFWLQVSRQTGFTHVPGVSAVYRYELGTSGVSTTMSVESKLACQTELFAKWRDVFSVVEWSETLSWFARQHDLIAHQAAGLAQRRAELEAELAALVNSRSWKMTAPFRWLRGLVRREPQPAAIREPAFPALATMATERPAIVPPLAWTSEMAHSATGDD